MRRFFIFLFISCFGLFSCSGNNTPEMTFEEDDDGITIASKEFELSLMAESPWETGGHVVKAFNKDSGLGEVFSGSFLLMWDDVAIELAEYHNNKKTEESFNELSEEAQDVIRQYGCPAKFLNDNSVSITTVASNAEIHKALKSIEERDEVSFEGYMVSVDYAEYKGETAEWSSDSPDLFCVTLATINDETYGE